MKKYNNNSPTTNNVTQSSEVLAMIAELAGFLCVGHGYYVDLVTLR